LYWIFTAVHFELLARSGATGTPIYRGEETGLGASLTTVNKQEVLVPHEI